MYLDEDIQKNLRKNSVIAENEVLTKEGDIFVAINVISQNRRIVKLSDTMILECGVNEKPQILKG